MNITLEDCEEVTAMKSLFNETKSAMQQSGKNDDIKMSDMPQFFDRTVPLFAFPKLSAYRKKRETEQERKEHLTKSFIVTEYSKVKLEYYAEFMYIICFL